MIDNILAPPDENENEKILNDHNITKVYEALERHASDMGGKLYTKINHPYYSDISSSRTSMRSELILPLIFHNTKTALDVGTHLGAFLIEFDRIGIKATGVEVDPNYFKLANEIKMSISAHYEILNQPFNSLTDVDFDVILALNIFHHFLDTREAFSDLCTFLSRISYRQMFIQTHRDDEKSDRKLHRPMLSHEFVKLVKLLTGKKHDFLIDFCEDLRPIYMIF